MAGLPLRTDENVRLRCVGARRVVERYGQLADQAFEPAFFNASLAAPFTTAMKIAWWTTVLAALLLINVPQYGALWWLIAAPLVGHGVILLLWPTYFRVVPGRLDVLRYRPFRKHATLLAQYPLREARLLVHLRKWLLVIECPGRERVLLPIARVPHRSRLAWELLRAAVSTHTPGPLPEDELLG
jgi:hypothetical protein